MTPLADAAEWFYSWFDYAITAYMVTLLILGLVLVIVGWVAVNRYVRMRPLRDYSFVDQSELSLPVTVIIPAYDEEPTIIESLHSLLVTQFNQIEILVVNDGSTDATLDRLREEFALVPTDRTPRSGLATEPVIEVFSSSVDRRLHVIDKVNGGKADALNAGLNYAQFPLVCAVDADTMLDPGALGRLVWEFQAEPDTVATGGIVRIINGSQVKQGRITQVTTPRHLLANIQVVEYLRAFLGGRLAWSSWNCLLIISGAFGLFRRDVLVEAGGYDRETVTEDAEVILRIRRTRADRGEPCRIAFFPDPVCWTEAPVSLRQLARQRDRWQRGLGETLIKHVGMLFRPKYGRIGWIALPYYWLFEFLEPLITIVGLTLAFIGLLAGLVSPALFALLITFAFSFGFFVTMIVLMIEERAFRRYPSWTDLRNLAWAAFAENFGYRQWQAFVRARAIFRIWARAQHWGDMTRVGFASADRATDSETDPR